MLVYAFFKVQIYCNHIYKGKHITSYLLKFLTYLSSHIRSDQTNMSMQRVLLQEILMTIFRKVFVTICLLQLTVIPCCDFKVTEQAHQHSK